MITAIGISVIIKLKNDTHLKVYISYNDDVTDNDYEDIYDINTLIKIK